MLCGGRRAGRRRKRGRESVVGLHMVDLLIFERERERTGQEKVCLCNG